MRLNHPFFYGVVYALLFTMVASVQVRAEERYILLDVDKIESHDWSNKPPFLPGYAFKQLDIRKTEQFDPNTGKQTPQSLKWESLFGNERLIGDYKVQNRRIHMKKEFGTYEAQIRIESNVKKTVAYDKSVCGEWLELLKNNYGKPNIENKRDLGVYDYSLKITEFQWLKGTTAIEGVCSESSTANDSKTSKEIDHIIVGFGAKPIELAKKRHQIIGLSCVFESSFPTNPDGTAFPVEQKIDGMELKVKIDIDRKDAGPIAGGIWDDNMQITPNDVVAEWENKEKESKFSLTISRIDGNSSFKMVTPNLMVVLPGKCEKIDLKKKLF